MLDPNHEDLQNDFSDGCSGEWEEEESEEIESEEIESEEEDYYEEEVSEDDDDV